MYAIIASGGKQLRVEKDDRIKVEKLDVQKGDTVEFPVLLLSGDGSTQIGTPTVQGAVVKGEVLSQDKAKKVIVFKYKPKINIRKSRTPSTIYTGQGDGDSCSRWSSPDSFGIGR